MSDESEWRALLAVADRLEPEMRLRFLQAIESVRAGINLTDLSDALNHGRVVPDSVIDLAPLNAELRASVDLIVTAVHEAGGLAATHVSLKVGSPLRFDLTNPAAIDLAKTLSADLVANVGAETRAAIREIIGRAFTDGLTVDQSARLIRATIGQTRQAAQAIANYRDALIEQGIPGPRLTRMVDRYAKQRLGQRARAIARTEIMGASNGGQDVAWRQAVAKGFLSDDVETRWLVTDDDRLCKRCLSMADQRRKLGEAFECPLDGTTVLFPPLHTMCRCVRVIVTR